MQIVIVLPRASWTADFLALRPGLLRAAPARSYVHHIGSTAVPGLVAKDVIDVQVTVYDLDQVEDAAFEREEFQSTSILNDHCPPVFDIIVEGANAWAEITGWSEPSGD